MVTGDWTAFWYHGRTCLWRSLEPWFSKASSKRLFVDSSENNDKKNLKNLLNNGSQGVPLSFGFEFGKKNRWKKCVIQIRRQFDEKKSYLLGHPVHPQKSFSKSRFWLVTWSTLMLICLLRGWHSACCLSNQAGFSIDTLEPEVDMDGLWSLPDPYPEELADNLRTARCQWLLTFRLLLGSVSVS